ncbi:vacuolar protein sorting-associated protein 13D isoform X2 [Orussus abietinus]|uniref:vacuolar protein sorting-associated protein 13D isoform X2 n=1 Tax=Orussus abietinus TaxID=222816 RepID=UPI0006256750|nr:vacuolar protein sorting-associated protein 13D isoform X2 [Orussus abietinus]
MLEGLVAWVLNNYLGKYVENLNTDQLSIALLSGEVELENLPLKRDALRHIGLPVEIKAGFIGKVRLQIPVRQIRTASWVIVIEQLYLVAGPICLDEYDHEAEEQAVQENKLSRLDALEARWRAEAERDPGYYATSYSSWLNYGTSLVTNIIENLQLNIKDVHFRYEDNVTQSSKNGEGVALGVTIGALSAQSCDASWIPGSTSWNLNDASFKLMELDRLSVYWNHLKPEQFFGILSLGDLAIAMSESKTRKWKYILPSVNARAHIKRDRSEKPLRSINKPRIVLDLLLDQVPLSITDVQYKEIVKCIQELEDIDRQRRQRRCRPMLSVSEDPKAWWRYAIRLHLGKDALKPKVTWEDMLRRGKENVAYVEICTKMLGTPTTILPTETKQLKDTIELERSFDELKVLREIALARVKPPKQPQSPTTSVPQARGMLVQWFPQWWGWYSKTPQNSTQTPSSTFDGELLDVLADTMDDDTLLRRDAIFGQFNFTLSNGVISLCTPVENPEGSQKTVMELRFERVQLTYESRPRSGSHKFSVSLGALYLHDYYTEKSTFPILVQPQVVTGPLQGRLRGSSEKLVSQATQQALFELVYEKRPLHLAAEHSLQVHSRSLDVVYNPLAMKWLMDFLCGPHRDSSDRRLQAMKRRTRRRLIRNWEQILEGDFVYRSSWDLRLKISAPQILLVERFTDVDAAVVVVDFGRLRLTNNPETETITSQPGSPAEIPRPQEAENEEEEEDEDDERYETPCSTPPGSKENGSLQEDHPQGISEAALHQRLYDRYSVDLADLQVLVGRVRDSWKHARTRGMSNLHVLERFNISLEVERRVVATTDPQYPSATISGNLPRLVVHVNEQKVEAIRSMWGLLVGVHATEVPRGVPVEPESPRKEEAPERNLAHVVMVQFIVDRMTFELQSRGRSVAELQVSGVKAALSKRPADLGASLSVHGLLLVDALQEFGPDFELLVASHRHVGMDSVSGSLWDSEPTSPTSPESPGSPDLSQSKRPTSPVALSRALTSLVRRDPRNPLTGAGLDRTDSEALIVVELVAVDEPLERLRVASIQFNNLDIIANQETIVEIVGFLRRVFPSRKSRVKRVVDRQESVTSLNSEFPGPSTRIEVSFDFHRLNVLLLRAVVQESGLVGQKIATATMCDARIQATLAAGVSVSGSLGGLQVLDQTPTGRTHQRILSVGRDPLADPRNQPMDHFPELSEQPEAFRFSASRGSRVERHGNAETTPAEVVVRVGSVWYTHAPHLISELRSCADEFKQYLKNLARQIGAAATDMAIGLVQAEDWSAPPRRRLPSLSLDGGEAPALALKLDVVLDSPVLVVPRSAHSSQVFVAHLGTMSLRHEPPKETPAKHEVTLEVRDMNLYSLEIARKSDRSSKGFPLRAEEVYSCKESGKPILHDTLLKVVVQRETITPELQSPGFLLEAEHQSASPVFQLHGMAITPLKVSLTRGQYEQALATIHGLFSSSASGAAAKEHQVQDQPADLRRFDLSVKVLFELPFLGVELKRDHLEQPLVELSMRDFAARYEKLQRLEWTLQVSLRSLLMEDLLCPVGSRHRCMMQSSAPSRARLPAGVSRSCPDLAFARRWRSEMARGSLPDRLETDTLYGAVPDHWRRKPVSSADTPNTPPPSPGAITSEENLVLIDICTTLPDPGSTSEQVLRKNICVDFNCLDLVVSVESWMVVFDFLGIGEPGDLVPPSPSASKIPEGEAHEVDGSSQRTSKTILKSEVELEVRSLTLVLTRGEREVARANVSDATMRILTDALKSQVAGSLGSMSLLDLSPHGRCYRERFLSSGRKALTFQYSSYATHGDSRNLDREYDARLRIRMAAVHYVHTQRFVSELQAFFVHFAQLQTAMTNLRAGGEADESGRRSRRLSLELHAGAPIILIPVSSRSEELVLLDLGELTANNVFEFSSVVQDCLLDVTDVELVNMDVYTGRRLKADQDGDQDEDTLTVCGFRVKKLGPSLLTEKCHLKLRVERNLDVHLSRAIPDISVRGTLSTMDCALDPAQYTLIRGLLAYNIGESLEDLRSWFTQEPSDPSEYPRTIEGASTKVWTKSCVTLELVNVTLKLHPNHQIAALACVNFIKSRLTLDSLSDGSQDVDLVSREILVTDTRFQDEPANRRSNVFTRILQPLKDDGSAEDRVQAEVHHRRRPMNSATTVLLHSMRLTAILDWWEAVKDFLILNSPEPEAVPGLVHPGVLQPTRSETSVNSNNSLPFELKLNITDSELVVVEDTSLKDTNAVILRSTTILSFRSAPQEGEKPLSCNLSHCELFSCILGLENETALSIIDPVGASLELTREKLLEVQLQPLSVRLSYHDVAMFSRMLSSLPKQTLWAKQRSTLGPPANQKSHIVKLSALGFAETDCEAALHRCNGQLDDAALWLTQNAFPSADATGERVLVRAVELETTCLKVCVIDDCRDADVPLLEITLTDLTLKQECEGPGQVSATFAVDYYNRVLSGWEPFVEPWRATLDWKQTLTSSLTPKRLQVKVDSDDSVNVNVTSTFVELVTLVKHNWTQDYYLSSKDSTLGRSLKNVLSYRRRSPFVPFALKNETGSKIWFKTLIATADDVKEIGQDVKVRSLPKRDKTWDEVPPGGTFPFTFEERGKLRHYSTHIVRRHQVLVMVDGWNPVDPVTVDRVGVYFRYANPEIRGTQLHMAIPKARVVFEVELEGSARKLVTVRSALRVVNKLAYPVDVKLEKSLDQFGDVPANMFAKGKTLQVKAQSVVSIPVTHTGVEMYLRPVHPSESYQYCMEAIDWTMVKKPSEVLEIQATCRTNRDRLFRMCVAVRRDNFPPDVGQMIPGHTISLLAPITVNNLLPHELLYNTGAENGRILPGESADLLTPKLEEHLEIIVQLDGYSGAGTILLAQCINSFTGRVRLTDSSGRILFLQAAVVVEKGSAVKINITAPYWIINKTGLPLVFRQEGVGTEAAGQFEEHEKARMVAPLLFSFSDEEASRTLAVRVGTGVHPNGIPQWSQHFHLQIGVQVHRLRVSLRDGRPDIVYLIGVVTRAARGRYRATTVVTLSPRYQSHNRSSYTLELAQKCFTTTVSHPDAQATYITAMPDCHMPFHWPRLDKDQLLCVRIIDVENCAWSGGITLDGNYSMTINVRDIAGKMNFLRVDVVLKESTYFIVFSDADTMPPPIRVDNFSEVPLVVNQNNVLDSLQWTVRPHSSVPYALDEPIQPAALVLTAPGGVTATYDLNILGESRGLTYENFIYIAFTGTFKTDGDLGTSECSLDPLDVETQRLVLEAGPGGWVALRRKQYGARSQLWRMTGNGQLQHEGSSPPRDKHSKATDKVLVLDIAGTAPQPFTYCPLALRRPDPRRRSTQTWRFTDDGRLCCAHQNMCVQSKDGFMGLHEGGCVARWQMWSEAVLGPQTHCDPPPIDQRVGRQRLRPGSGFLNVRVTTDGPTRVLQVLDIKERKTFALLEERDWSHIAVTQRPTQEPLDPESKDSRELQVQVSLAAGLGLSVVSRRPAEELVFSRFAGIALEFVRTPGNVVVDLSIADVQVDNQLFEAQCTSVLYIARNSRPENDSRPAVHVALEKLPSKNQNAEIYKHLIVSLKPLCVHLEERLILKLAAFAGAGRAELDVPVDENDFKAQRFVSEVSAAHAKRYYFGTLKLVPNQIKLSVLTSTKLPPELQGIKRKLGLTLIKFEDATIDLEPFTKKHPFESSQFLLHSIVKHFKDELKWQAAVILGSVDFLGNPLGFVNDVSEGVSGLIYEGSVKTLVKNVTHGLSNSAAKMTESLSDGLGRVIMDERHEEARQKIRANTVASSDHLVAGLKGLGFGLLGGVTSIFTQTYDGAANEGFPGFFTGFSKGVVGTITKPVVGFLDLASETATALRETSRSAHRAIPKRDRPPRVASGPAGLLPPNNQQQAEGQEFLYSINNRDYSELFVAYEFLRSGTEDLRVLVSNERVRVISGGTRAVVTEVSLADLLHCQPTHKVESNGTTLHYIELTSRTTDSGQVAYLDGSERLRKPLVRCDSEGVAKWVSQQINYAKGMHEERSMTLTSSDNILDDIHCYK